MAHPNGAPSSTPYPDNEFRAYYRLSVGGILRESFGAFFSNFFKFTLISLLVLSPVVAGTFLLLSGWDASSFDSRFGSTLIYLAVLVAAGTLLLQPIATGAIIYGVFRGQQGQRAGLGKCLAVGFSRLLPLLGIALLTGLAVCGMAIPAVMLFAAAPAIGLLLALGTLVPVLMFMCAAYLAAPATVVERTGVLDAFRRSFHLTRGNRGRIFGVIVVLGIIKWVIQTVFETVLVSTPTGYPSHAKLTGFVDSYTIYTGLNFGIEAIFTAVTAAAAALVFWHLKVQTEGVDEAELAAVFD